MRTALAAVGLSLLAGACGGSSGGSSGGNGTSAGATAGVTSGSDNGASTTGKPATGGSSTGAPTTGGTGSGGLAAGQPCSANSACRSGVCGVAGSGNCCSHACATTDATCGATACDSSGVCKYPDLGTACGPSQCTDFTLSASASCNGLGACADGGAGECPDHLLCDDGGVACLTTCHSGQDCLPGLACNGASCTPPVATGSCTEDDDCFSQQCAGASDAGAGACCLSACPGSPDSACTLSSCDVTTGACIYPAGTVCGPAPSCVNAKLLENTCDSHGACLPSPASCPNNLACDATHDGCNPSCLHDADCASGAYCETDAGTCLLPIATGPCDTNEACTSGICGVSGIGHCCIQTCTNTAAPCGSTDCDGTGACTFPGGTTACGTVLESCTGSTQQNPSVCDGTGSCEESPPPTDCAPYSCGAKACLATCSGNTDCASGDFCDTTNSACCVGLKAGDTLAVDSKNGKDAACCGIGTNAACQTLHQAMTLIDAAGATGVTISATVAGAGGDWAPAKEVYPIVLGWGAELSAPGVYFTDAKANLEIIDIAPFSANDIGGGASIVGSATSQIVIGQDSQATQSTDSSAVRVESGQTLSIANALVNGNAASGTTALSVAAGARLLLGSDQTAGVTGTVDIGSAAPGIPDGWDGLICESDVDAGTGCTISDATLAGQASLVISNQEDQDLAVGDFGTVILTSSPVVGVAPPQAGYLQCGTKNDMTNQQTGAILLQGSATMTFSNGAVQCIDGEGFELVASANGTPTLTLSSTIIQNTEMAIYASAGAATATNCTIEFNYEGVEQDTDGVNSAAIDLSGGGVGTTTVVCSDSAESVTGAGMGPGVDVLNDTTKALNAAGVTWDTAGPDLFACGAGNANCTCKDTTCTSIAGTDDMNAVYVSTGLITITGNKLSAINCAPPGIFCGQGSPCPAWETCCMPAGSRKSQCVEGPACN